MIEKLVSQLKKEDIINFAIKNNLQVSNKEVDFIYNFIKNNYKTYIANPQSFDLTMYKSEFSEENYNFLEKLINKYKRMI